MSESEQSTHDDDVIMYGVCFFLSLVVVVVVAKLCNCKHQLVIREWTEEDETSSFAYKCINGEGFEFSRRARRCCHIHFGCATPKVWPGKTRPRLMYTSYWLDRPPPTWRRNGVRSSQNFEAGSAVERKGNSNWPGTSPTVWRCSRMLVTRQDSALSKDARTPS